MAQMLRDHADELELAILDADPDPEDAATKAVLDAATKAVLDAATEADELVELQLKRYAVAAAFCTRRAS